MKLVSVTLEGFSISRAINDERNRRWQTERGPCDVGKHNLWLNAICYDGAREALPVHDLNAVRFRVRCAKSSAWLCLQVLTIHSRRVAQSTECMIDSRISRQVTTSCSGFRQSVTK